jgi:ribosomal protein S18 acetylase RimI-like enzyme
VYDRFKSQGIGKVLCEELIRVAKQMGYTRMRLDTISRLGVAVQLYEGLGFRDIARYRHNPDPTTRYMELTL